MWNVISLDGYFEGEKAWDLDFHDLAWGKELENFSIEQLKSADMVIYGEKTYKGMADYWSTAEGETADYMNKIPKVVCSSTLKTANWNNTIIMKDAVTEIPKLKQEGDGNMFVFGSGILSKSLMKANLFDEYRLCVVPVFLGKGRRLFNEGSAVSKTKASRSTVALNRRSRFEVCSGSKKRKSVQRLCGLRLQRRAARQRARPARSRDTFRPLRVVDPVHITPRGGGDYGLTGTLTDISRLDLRPPFGVRPAGARAVVRPQRRDEQLRAQPDVVRPAHLHRARRSATTTRPSSTGPPYGFDTIGCDSVPVQPGDLDRDGRRRLDRLQQVPAGGHQDHAARRRRGPARQQDHAAGRAELEQRGLQDLHAGAGRRGRVPRQLAVRRRRGEEPVPGRGAEGPGLPDPADRHLAARPAARPQRPRAREDPDQDHADQQQARSSRWC